MGMHDDRIKEYQERRLVLMLQREQVKLSLEQIDRGIFACEGAMEALSAVNAKRETPPKDVVE